MGSVTGILRILIFIVLTLLVIGEDPLQMFTAFSPLPQIFFGLSLLLMIFLRPQLDWILAKVNAIPDRLFLGLAMGLAFALMLAANVLVLGRVPHVTDSVAYLFQAKILSEGALSIPAGVAPEFFMPHFFYVDDGRMISLFQPGWPAVLAVGVKLGIPWLVNPILGALMLWPSYRIGLRAFGRAATRLGVVILLLTPFYIFMSASFMAHSLCALLGLIALDQALLYRVDKRPDRMLAFSFALGLMVDVRALNAMILLVPLSVILLPSLLHGRIPFRHITSGIAIVLVFIAIQLGVNWELTGSPTTFPQDEYFQKTEEIGSCHRLGFGDDVGCEQEHGPYSFKKGYHFKDVFSVTRQRLDSLWLNLLGSPLLLLIMLLPLLQVRLGREGLCLYALIASLIGGYMLFYFHGNCYGPRFYYEGVTAVGIFIALGILQLDDWMGQLAGRFDQAGRFFRALVPALLLAMLCFSLLHLSPKLIKNYSRFRGVDTRPADIVAESGVSNALVLVPGTDISFSSAANFNSPGFNGDVIYALHHFDQSVQLMYLHQQREFYRLEPKINKLVKLQRQAFKGVIFTEMETKTPAFESVGGFARWRSIQPYRKEHREPAVLQFKARQNDAYFSIRQMIFKAGEYRVELEAMRGPLMGDWVLEVEGQRLSPAFQAYAHDYGIHHWQSDNSVRLQFGLATFTFRLVGKLSDRGRSDIGLDTMTLRRIPEGLTIDRPRVIDEGIVEKGKLRPIPEGGIHWKVQFKR